MNDPDRYDNLVYHPRPIAKNTMDPMKRAAQFSSFAALTGYEEQIEEAARLTDAAVILDEENDSADA